jgi:hypothetical protein
VKSFSEHSTQTPARSGPVASRAATIEASPEHVDRNAGGPATVSPLQALADGSHSVQRLKDVSGTVGRNPRVGRITVARSGAEADQLSDRAAASAADGAMQPVLQRQRGLIFRRKFVVENGTGKVYFLKPDQYGLAQDGDLVAFDPIDENYVRLSFAARAAEPERARPESARPVVDASKVERAASEKVAKQAEDDGKKEKSWPAKEERKAQPSAKKEEEWVPPAFRQWSNKSCAIEAARMVLASVTGGEEIGHSAMIKMFEKRRAYDPNLGAQVEMIPDIMNDVFKEQFLEKCQMGVEKGLSLETVQKLAHPRKPLCAIFKDPNHLVVVDAVTGDPPNRVITYRDPAIGEQQQITEANYAKRATGTYYVLK